MNLMSLTDIPIKVGRTFTGAQEQCWPDALPASTSELNTGSLGALSIEPWLLLW